MLKAEIDPGISAEPEFTSEVMSVETEKREKLEGYFKKLREYLDEYSEVVPPERITPDFPDYPNYKVQETYIIGVQNFFREIVDSAILGDNSYFVDCVKYIDRMLLEKAALAYKGSEGATIKSLPEDIQKILLRKIQKGTQPEEFMGFLNSALKDRQPHERMAVLLGIIQESPQSRIPSKGEIPQDIIDRARADKDILNERLKSAGIIIYKVLHPEFEAGEGNSSDDGKLRNKWTEEEFEKIKVLMSQDETQE